MVFSSAVFLFIFLPIVFVINLLIPKKWSNVFLLLASLFFYAWGEPVYVLLMIFTITLNWLIGIGIEKYTNRARIIMILGVVCDVLILVYYKYMNFFVQTFNTLARREVVPQTEILLPIGISFFSFQAISYIVDVYRKDTKASNNFISVALYISYFPQLIAGPIVKYKEINRQIESRSITSTGVAEGFRRFIYGLGKKVIISNVMGKSADAIFSLPMNQVGCKTAWLGIVVYIIQLYYDFSGYSDMAIGLGKMFGFDIPENFNYPYLSKSVTEIWRRWHISLGTWFREYVYIPLGGSKSGTVRTYINLSIVFFLTGLWHGASFSFIAFGILNGLFMVIERAGFKSFLDRMKLFPHIYTMIAWMIVFTPFRINNLARTVSWWGRMFIPWKYNVSEFPVGRFMSNISWVVLCLAILGTGIIQKSLPEKFRNRWKYSIPEWLCCVFILLLSCAYIAGDTYNPFIYFQF